MPENEYSASGDGREDAGDRSQRLTNEDFRRLLMTPRASVHSSSSAPHSTSATSGSSQHTSSSGSMQPPFSKTPISPSERTSVFGDVDDEGGDPEDRAERRRKKKSFYAKLKKQEEDKMAELAKKYRDRARERREGANPDYQSEDPLSAAGGYRAVAPDVKSGMDAAERRRQMIQESKFLGGDMEHTHLVKGLDYALLQKVRSEIQVKEQEEEDEMESLMRNKRERRDVEEEEMQFKTTLGRNIYRAAFKNRGPIERNELFSPGRTAYVIELEEEGVGGIGVGANESDIPTTLIRSRSDVPSLESAATLTTNDIVINKLAQILSYLRQGTRHSRKGRKKEAKAGAMGAKGDADGLKTKVDDSIYGEIGDYIPGISKRGADKDREKSEKRRAPYFEKPEEAEEAMLGGKAGWTEAEKKKAKEEEDERVLGALIKTAQRMGSAMGASLPASNSGQGGAQPPQTKAQQLLSRLAAEPQGYAECYPGLEEMQDAIDDSDDEVDYTKMDLGNKKGPIGRWDFDTQEEYSEYMNSKEALPKAAFQYGVKMADGRRTRKYHREKNEKAELDREWQKIQNIIQKRKGGSSSLTPGTPLIGGAHKMDGEPDFKVPRY
ncbi:protein Red [Ischnura elegans]|uniref:protein Red n=1 Tax=Ischnura elegans TaxID=197161 RepID=UPI001ED875D8|nr:protein Red [Ischnura elegans]